MLIIPIIGKISWRNPPVITILLILVNAAVYFGLQHGDTAAAVSARKYYISSGLADIEIPRYLAYRDGRTYSDADRAALETLSQDALHQLLRGAIQDGRFQRALDRDEIILPEDAQYWGWKPVRAEYLKRRDAAVAARWGFRPVDHRPATAATYMFLHGGVGHLIGNMVFLWLVGCILEYGAGRLSYLVIYLLGGLSAVAMFYLLNPYSAIPLVGASGAIAALMGALAVLFGKTPIRIFFSVGFYFNTFRILAVYLLPLWIGNELFQLFYGAERQVAYTAHIGGLIGGALIAAVHRKFRQEVDSSVLGDDDTDTTSPVLEAAMAHMSRLEFGAARRLLKGLQQETPDHPEVLRLLFGIDRHYPQRPQIHTTAAAWMSHLARDMAQRNTLAASYDRYIAAVKTPHLPPPLLLRIGQALTALGRPAEAHRIIAHLIKREPAMPGLPAACLRLSILWGNANAPDRKLRWEQVILKRFPTSPEAAELREARPKGPNK